MRHLWSARPRIYYGFFGLFLGAALLAWDPMHWPGLHTLWGVRFLWGTAVVSAFGMMHFKSGTPTCFALEAYPLRQEEGFIPANRSLTQSRERKIEPMSEWSTPMHAIHVHTIASAIFVGLVFTIPSGLWKKAPLTTRALGPFVHFLWRWGFPALGIEVLSVLPILLVIGYRGPEDKMLLGLDASYDDPQYHQQKTQPCAYTHQPTPKNTQAMRQTGRTMIGLPQSVHRFRPIHYRGPWHHVQKYHRSSKNQDYGSHRPQKTAGNPNDNGYQADTGQAHPQAMPNLPDGLLRRHMTHPWKDASSPSETLENPWSRSNPPVFHGIMPPYQKEAMSPFMKNAQHHIQAIQNDKTYDHVWITSRTLIRLSFIVFLSMGLAHIGILLWLRT